MIIVLKPHPSPEVVEHVLERIAALGLTPHLSQGVARTIIGVIGDEDKLQVQPLQAIPGVEQVVPILKPFKLASREFHGDRSVMLTSISALRSAVIAGDVPVQSPQPLGWLPLPAWQHLTPRMSGLCRDEVVAVGLDVVLSPEG